MAHGTHSPPTHTYIIKVYDIKPGGRDIPVDDASKQEYIRLLAQFKMVRLAPSCLVLCPMLHACLPACHVFLFFFLVYGCLRWSHAFLSFFQSLSSVILFNPYHPPAQTNSIKEQLRSFLGGLHDMVPKELIAIFTPSELELLSCGLPEIDLDDMQVRAFV